MIENQGKDYNNKSYNSKNYDSIDNNIGKSRAGKPQKTKKISEKERAKQRERNRERERRSRGKRKYGQAKLKHAKKGVTSCVIAGTVLVTFSALLAAAYVTGGTAAGYIGGIGIVDMILSGVGIYCAAKGFKEREKDYLTCKIGMGFNIFFLLTFIGIFCRGLF